MLTSENKIVVHYLGGKLTKGYTFDFNQNRETFHVVASQDQVEEATIVNHDDLKALFFVKTLEGNPGYEDPVFSEENI